MFRSIVLAAIATAALAVAARADDTGDDSSSLDDIPHVTMIGTARTEARPDLATITVGVTGEQPSAKAAAADVAKRTTALIDAAKTFGVTSLDIATQTVSLTQTFDPIKDSHGNVAGQRPRGFSAENIVAIKWHDLDRTGALVEALIAAGANRFDGVAYSVERPEPLIEKLVGSAVRAARAQAEAAAEAGGVRLGRVLMIERSGEGGETRMFANKRSMATAPATMPFEPGTRSYTASVAVTWAIEPR